MNVEQLHGEDMISSSLSRTLGATEGARAHGEYQLECRDSEGNLKWTIGGHNLVVNEGLQDMNGKYFKGSGYTAAWYLGLISGTAPSIAAADTLASHAGWTEVTDYSQSTRPACSFGTPTAADPSVATNSLSPATFSINATTTVGGAFLTSNSTKGGTTGILFSAADFSSPGDRSDDSRTGR